MNTSLGSIINTSGSKSNQPHGIDKQPQLDKNLEKEIIEKMDKLDEEYDKFLDDSDTYDEQAQEKGLIANNPYINIVGKDTKYMSKSYVGQIYQGVEGFKKDYPFLYSCYVASNGTFAIDSDTKMDGIHGNTYKIAYKFGETTYNEEREQKMIFDITKHVFNKLKDINVGRNTRYQAMLEIIKLMTTFLNDPRVKKRAHKIANEIRTQAGDELHDIIKEKSDLGWTQEQIDAYLKIDLTGGVPAGIYTHGPSERDQEKVRKRQHTLYLVGKEKTPDISIKIMQLYEKMERKLKDGISAGQLLEEMTLVAGILDKALREIPELDAYYNSLMNECVEHYKGDKALDFEWEQIQPKPKKAIFTDHPRMQLRTQASVNLTNTTRTATENLSSNTRTYVTIATVSSLLLLAIAGYSYHAYRGRHVGRNITIILREAEPFLREQFELNTLIKKNDEEIKLLRRAGITPSNQAQYEAALRQERDIRRRLEELAQRRPDMENLIDQTQELSSCHQAAIGQISKKEEIETTLAKWSRVFPEYYEDIKEAQSNLNKECISIICPQSSKDWQKLNSLQVQLKKNPNNKALIEEINNFRNVLLTKYYDDNNQEMKRRLEGVIEYYAELAERIDKELHRPVYLRKDIHGLLRCTDEAAFNNWVHKSYLYGYESEARFTSHVCDLITRRQEILKAVDSFMSDKKWSPYGANLKQFKAQIDDSTRSILNNSGLPDKSDKEEQLGKVIDMYEDILNKAAKLVIQLDSMSQNQQHKGYFSEQAKVQIKSKIEKLLNCKSFEQYRKIEEIVKY